PPPPPPQPQPADGKVNPRVIAENKPAYPNEAMPHGVGASVWVSIAIDASGQVAEANAARWQLTIDKPIDDPTYWASHPERPFLDAAEAAARKWTFAPPEANTRTSVELMFTFRMAAKSAEVAAGGVPAVEGQPQLVTVGGAVKAPQKIFDVAPDYPAEAMA